MIFVTATSRSINWKKEEKIFELPKDMLVYIRIVDNKKGGWGHMAVDKIGFE